MFRIRYLIIACIALLVVLTGCGSPTSIQQSTPTAQQPPTQQNSPISQSSPTSQSALKHIFYIMMENHGTNDIIGNTADAPYLNQLASSYGVATHYFGVTHPSLPNYLAAISGDFQGIWDDCAAGVTSTCAPQAFVSGSPLLTSNEAARASNRPHMFNGQTLVDQLEAHHMTWKAYMQSMPSVGFTGVSTELYAQKHDPFMYFTSIHNNPARLQRIVPFSQFDQDSKSSNTRNFVWITPDACSDMHGIAQSAAQSIGIPDCATYDGLIARGDNFIHTIVPEIMNSPSWKEGSAIVIVWDENDAGSSGCCNSPTGLNGATLGGADVPMIVITSNGPHHIVLSDASYNHYSLLATIEQIWGLGCLANTCNSPLMTKLFE
jgi:phosphatidylinositol-3-phosphatase